jgi:hypothetical protein
LAAPFSFTKIELWHLRQLGKVALQRRIIAPAHPASKPAGAMVPYFT